jgi:hypothetical protein
MKSVKQMGLEQKTLSSWKKNISTVETNISAHWNIYKCAWTSHNGKTHINYVFIDEGGIQV